MIRKAKLNDLKELKELATYFAKPKYEVAFYFLFILLGGVYVYQLKDVIVGFLVIDPVDNLLWRLAVRPEFRKQGIGSALINNLNRPYIKGYSKLEHIHFYKQLGFEPKGRILMKYSKN